MIIERYADDRCKGYIIHGKPADCVIYGLMMAKRDGFET
jgi:broad specificity polyphosphatase/5'/3'-nucleotidase SurE